MPHPFRQAFARWAAALLLGVVAYPLSYAPVVKLRIGSANEHVGTPWKMTIADGNELPVYRPVDWLIDRTPLKTPMFLWARLWGVRAEFNIAYWERANPMSGR